MQPRPPTEDQRGITLNPREAGVRAPSPNSRSATEFWRRTASIRRSTLAEVRRGQNCQRCRLWFQLRPGSYNAAGLIDFLRDLKKHLRRQQAILIWDGLPAHKSREMRAYLESEKSWLSVEMLPGYSPDLNPVEDLWGNVKGQELANRCVEGLADAEAALRSGLERVRRSKLPLSFLRHTGLLF